VLVDARGAEFDLERNVVREVASAKPSSVSASSASDAELLDYVARVGPSQPEADTYMCPAGHVLASKHEVMRLDRLIVYAARDCAGCSLKPRCTTAERR
jgi:hypothetical protein